MQKGHGPWATICSLAHQSHFHDDVSKNRADLVFNFSRNEKADLSLSSTHQLDELAKLHHVTSGVSIYLLTRRFNQTEFSNAGSGMHAGRGKRHGTIDMDHT